MFQFVKELRNLEQQKGLSKAEAAQRMAEIKLPLVLEFISEQTTWIVVSGMWVGATFVTLVYFQWMSLLTTSFPTGVQAVFLGLIPVVFGFSFVMIGSVFASIGRPGEIAGKFPRSASHPIYALRRFYGTAWSQVYYFKPLYAAFLSVPTLKKILFKAFGFKGKNMDFTVYPDSWIRDLPLLHIGKGTYLANRCTVGTNICLNDGSILVGSCEFGEKALIGHLVIFGLGCKIGNNSELGIATSLGIRVMIGDGTSVAPKASLYHASEIGNNVKIGACAFVGIKAKIADGVELKPAAVIPAGAVVSSQADAEKYFSSEMEMLKTRKDELTEILGKNLDAFAATDR